MPDEKARIARFSQLVLSEEAWFHSVTFVLKHFPLKLRSKILQLAPNRLRLALRYRAIHGRLSLLIRPKTFNEKVSLRMVIDRRPLLVTLSDKVKVREYIAAKIGPHVLNNIPWLGKDVFTMLFDHFPNAFVIKANHGFGFVRIVTDKSAVKRDDVIREAGGWLKLETASNSTNGPTHELIRW